MEINYTKIMQHPMSCALNSGNKLRLFTITIPSNHGRAAWAEPRPLALHSDSIQEEIVDHICVTHEELLIQPISFALLQVSSCP
jgi:hypothetical protein